MKVFLFKLVIVIFLFGCRKSNQNSLVNSHQQNESNKITDSLTLNITKDTAELNLRAHLLYINKEYLGAIQEYSELIEIDSLNGKYYYGTGYCLAQLSRYDESISYYQRAADLDYDKFECFKSIGIIYYFMLKDNEHAANYFIKSLEINPNDKEVKSFLLDINKTDKLNL